MTTSTQNEGTHQNWNIQPIINIYVLMMILSTILLLYIVCYNFVVNAPILDDFRAVLTFLLAWNERTDLKSSLYLLIEPHNEHRIVLTHLFTLIDVGLFGTVSFQRLEMYAALALIPIWLLIYAFTAQVVARGDARDTSSKLLFCALLAWLVFRPEDVKHLAYPMANIQALWNVAFSLLFFFALSKEGIGYRALSFAALLGALSSSSPSLLLLPLAAVKFALERRWLPAAAALMAGVICGVLYSTESATLPTMIDAVQQHLLSAIVFFFALVGSSTFGFGSTRHILPLFTGVLIVASCAVAVARTRNVNLFVVFAFLLSCDVLVALGRVELYQDQLMEKALDGRYRIYSVVLVALLVGLAFRHLQTMSLPNAAKRYYAPTLVVMSALLCVNSYSANLPRWARWHDNQRQMLMGHAWKAPRAIPEMNKKKKRTMKAAIRKGLYRPPI